MITRKDLWIGAAVTAVSFAASTVAYGLFHGRGFGEMFERLFFAAAGQAALAWCLDAIGRPWPKARP